MGTSFSCTFEVTARPSDGLIQIVIGPFMSGDLIELLDWLGSPDGRAKMIAHVGDALIGDPNA